MPLHTTRDETTMLDTSETILEAADRIFPEYLTLTEELFGSLKRLGSGALKGYGQGLSSSRPSSRSSMTSIEEPAETLRKLVALDKQLRLFVDRLERHQKTQRQIEDAQMRVIDQEAGFMEMHRVLSEKHFECDELVHEASQMLEKARAARNDPLDVADITAYATRLAKYTMDSYTPDRLHEPPIPQEQHMRMSLLFQEGHSVGVTANMDGQAETGTPDHIPHFTFDADHSISPKKDEDAIVNHETLLDLDFEDFD